MIFTCSRFRQAFPVVPACGRSSNLPAPPTQPALLMRRIGTLDDSVQAQKFCDYLVTKEIDATWDDQNEGCDIWIREESAVETARQELAEFRQDSSAAKYQVGDKVRKIREQRVADNARRQKNMKKFSGSRTPGRG